jgi:hypothetical protein
MIRTLRSETTAMLLLSRFFGRRDVRSIHRPWPSRRPNLESLEGRQLLSSVKLFVEPAIVGQHIGTGVAEIKHVPVDLHIVGSHIGSNVVVSHPLDLNPQPLPPG